MRREQDDSTGGSSHGKARWQANKPSNKVHAVLKDEMGNGGGDDMAGEDHDVEDLSGEEQEINELEAELKF